MDINSYEAFKVIDTMREYGAPYSAISTATGFPENKLKAFCRKGDLGICWIEVYLSIIRREDTGRVFSMEALLGENTIRFCRERNRAFWKEAERIGCIPQMANTIISHGVDSVGPITCIFDLRRYGAERDRFLSRIAEIYSK